MEEAQRIAAQLLTGGSPVEGVLPGDRDLEAIDVNPMELVHPRSVGVEDVRLGHLSGFRTQVDSREDECPDGPSPG